jgi:chromate transporter
MQRNLSEKLGWISQEDFIQGLALAQLTPGPMATQVAIYFGFVQNGVLGATLAGVALVLPSFIMVVLLAAAYVEWHGLRWMQALFYGVGAAVLAIVARSAYKLARRTLGHKRFLWIIFAMMAILTAAVRKESLALFVLCGIASILFYCPPSWLRSFKARSLVLPVIGLFAPEGRPPASWSLLKTIFLFFMKASALIYGGGLVIVPFLYGGVVQRFHWLTDRQFVDAVAVALITPGPILVTVGFIGYLVAGLAGASLAALGAFLPVYFFVILLAPWVRKYGAGPRLYAFAEGVTAAAVGALTGAVFLIAPGSIRDFTTAAIAAVALLLLIRTKIPEPVLIALSGVVGLLLYKG